MNKTQALQVILTLAAKYRYQWGGDTRIANAYAAHRSTPAKVRGPNATKGKRHASLASRSNKRK